MNLVNFCEKFMESVNKICKKIKRIGLKNLSGSVPYDSLVRGVSLYQLGGEVCA